MYDKERAIVKRIRRRRKMSERERESLRSWKKKVI